MAVTLSSVNRGSFKGDNAPTVDDAYDAFGKVNSNELNLKNAVDLVLDLPEDTILGRISTGTGNPEKLTPAQARTVMNVDVAGTINYTHPATHPWSILTSTPTTLSGYGISDTSANFNSALSDGSFAFSGGAHHDNFSDFVAEEHIRWDLTGVEVIHADRYTNTTYTAGDFNHDDLANIPANDHIDWTLDQGATNIHSGNYTNTTYTAGDFNHDDLANVPANDHIDWTVDQGATNIHSGNYTNTVYTHPATHPWSILTGTPTTLAGYGITDAAPSSHLGGNEHIDWTSTTSALSTTGNGTFGSIITSRLDTGNGTEVVINAGESSGQATGQTGEIVYINAEGGLQINSSPDNWGTAWAGRDTATICGAGGNSTFPGTVTATSFSGANVTSGSNPGHTHTGSSISALDAGDITTGTLPVTRGGTGVTTSTGTGSTVRSASPTLTGTTTYATLSGSATSSYDKLRVWNSSAWAFGMVQTTFGGNSSWTITSRCNTTDGYGFWWGDATHTAAQGAMALTMDGYLTVAGGARIGYGESDTTHPAAGLAVSGNIAVTGTVDGVDVAAHASATTGVHGSTGSGTASTIVERNASGDINCRLVRPTYANQATISGAMAYRINNTTDNYIRFCSSQSAIRTWLGVNASGTTQSWNLNNYEVPDIISATNGQLTSVSTREIGATYSTHPASNLAYTGVVDWFLTSGTVTAGYAVELIGDATYARVRHADADFPYPVVGIALETKTSGLNCKILIRGHIKLTGGQYGVTGNTQAYASATAGYITSTAQTIAGNYSKVIGWGVATDVLFVNPQWNTVLVA